MIYNTIQYVVDNGIGTLTFNRPTVANGFNIEMCKEILEVLDKAHNDDRNGTRCKRRGYRVFV